MTKRMRFAPVFLIAVVSGCMVGPNYKRPAVQTPATYRDLRANPQLQTQTPRSPTCRGGKSSKTRS